MMHDEDVFELVEVMLRRLAYAADNRLELVFDVDFLEDSQEAREVVRRALRTA